MTLTRKSKRELQKERRGEETAQDRLRAITEPLLTQLHERMLQGITYRDSKSGTNKRMLPADISKIDMSHLPEQFLTSLVIRAIGEIDDHGTFQRLVKDLQQPLMRKASGDSSDLANKALEAGRKHWAKAQAAKAQGRNTVGL